MDEAGVYTITCLPTGKVYVGSTTRSLRVRFNQHRHAMRRGDRSNPKLLNAWRKHGSDAFEFKPLLICRPEDALFYEQRAIDVLKPELNICAIAGNCAGVRHTAATKAKALARVNRQWASGQHSKEKLRARSVARSRRFLVRGEMLTILGVVAKYGVTKNMVTCRLRRGWSGEDLIKPAREEFRRYVIDGKPHTSIEVQRVFGILQETLLYRWRKGLRGNDLVAPSRNRNRRAR